MDLQIFINGEIAPPPKNEIALLKPPSKSKHEIDKSHHHQTRNRTSQPPQNPNTKSHEIGEKEGSEKMDRRSEMEEIDGDGFAKRKCVMN